MRRPEVRLDNPEVHEYFAQRGGPNYKFMRFFHGLSGALFHPARKYLEGSEPRITHHIERGKPTIFSLSHVTWFDPLIHASAIQKEQSLKPARGNIVIPANAPYFNKRIMGRIITAGGAIPVFRDKDKKSFGDTSGMTEEEVNLRRITVNQTMVDVCTDYLDNGTHVAIFAEGTRNRGDRKILQKMQAGIGKIIEGAEKADELLVVCMSGYFGERRIKNIIDPSVAIGHVAIGGSSRDVMGEIVETQQAALDLAVADYKERTSMDSGENLQSRQY